MHVEPLTPDHLFRLDVQPYQRVWRDNLAALGLIDMGGGRNRRDPGATHG